MKIKSVAVLVLATAIGPAALAANAGAGSARFTTVVANLTLRPGIAGSSHRKVTPPDLYGAFFGTYNSGTGIFTYAVKYKSLKGSATRVVVRSRTTGATFAVLCSPCDVSVLAKPSDDELPVSHLSGKLSINPDTGFLITHGRTFVEVDTTAYPSGEIGAPIYPLIRLHGGGGGLPFTGPPSVGEYPRCC